VFALHETKRGQKTEIPHIESKRVVEDEFDFGSYGSIAVPQSGSN
jgi:hypothetical protein